MPEVHPGIAPLAALLGTWTGRGSGDYPTIAGFDYLEDVTFSHTGKPFLVYTQRTRSAQGAPMHAETGYLRMPAPGRAELVLAQPTGVTEVDEGTVRLAPDTGADVLIELESTSIGRTATAKDVAAVQRSFRLTGDELAYTLRMAAVGQPMTHHLAGTLHRMP